MSNLHPIRGRRTNEELFFEHYSEILGWASQLSHRDRVDAEDLVQDFYIQVAKMNKRLAEVDEIEPYLFKILRNLHYSRLRQKGRSPIYELSVVDYDSLERSLAAVDRHGLLLVRAQLRSICDYVCERKNAARSASLFILRFFFGYYPSEVVKITLSTRATVDKALQMAREEAQQFVDRPGAARVSGSQERRGLLVGTGDGSSYNLFSELRQTIFASRQGACFSVQDLERRYHSPSQLPSQFPAPQRFTAPELAHLVSCRSCLDRANTILGLPSLDERSPDETIGRDNPPGSGSGSPKLTTHKVSKRETAKKDRRALERRMREFFEHRPKGLEICVDGDSRAAQPVNSEVTELYFRLSRSEAPEFVEVLSEQRVRLAYLHLGEPASFPALEQRQDMTLSDGRSLELAVSFANDVPTVHVVYRDPVFVQMSALDADIESSAGMAIVESDRHEAPADEQVITLYKPRPRFSRVRSGLATLRARILRARILRVWIRGLRSTSSSSQDAAAVTLALREATRERALFSRKRVIFAGAALFALAVAACFTLWPRKAHTMTADTFLDRAAASENIAAGPNNPEVIYQYVRIKTASEQIERSIHRDSTGRRKPKRNLDPRAAGLESKLAAAGVQWDEPLSARQYREWHDRAQVTSDTVKKTGENLLTLTTTVAGAEVREESLTVRSSDFHPVARSVSYRDSGEVEIAELEYAVLPWSDTDSEWFEPLAGGRPALHALPHLPTPLTEAQMDEAELGAMLALHQLDADADKRVQIVRGLNGVQVKGIVEDDARKRELETQLRMVPHVLPSIFTFAEMERAARPLPNEAEQSPALALRSEEGVVSPLEKYLLAKGDTRDEMSRLANRLSDSSSVIDRESVRLATVMGRYGSDPQLSPNGHSMLDQLVAERKSAILGALDTEEQSLIAAGVNIRTSSGTPISSLDFEEAVRRNRKLCDELVFGDASHGRSAADILPELAQTIHQLHAATLQLSSQQPDNASARKEP